jgi:hypothetical protein
MDRALNDLALAHLDWLMWANTQTDWSHFDVAEYFYHRRALDSLTFSIEHWHLEWRSSLFAS